LPTIVPRGVWIVVVARLIACIGRHGVYYVSRVAFAGVEGYRALGIFLRRLRIWRHAPRHGRQRTVVNRSGAVGRPARTGQPVVADDSRARRALLMHRVGAQRFGSRCRAAERIPLQIGRPGDSQQLDSTAGGARRRIFERIRAAMSSGRDGFYGRRS